MDNKDLGSKLAVRRHFMAKYHHADADVLDCCHGKGIIWKRLKQEFQLQRFTAIDRKPVPGALRMCSVRYLRDVLWQHDVIDIDTYGRPWKHWAALIPRIEKPTTVFLTVGQTQSCCSQYELESLGIGALKMPNMLAAKASGDAVRYCLSRTCEFGIMITEGKIIDQEAHRMVYLGLRLQKES